LQARPRERKEGMFRKEGRAHQGRNYHVCSLTSPCRGAWADDPTPARRAGRARGWKQGGRACAGAEALEACRSRPSVLETPPTTGVPNGGGDLSAPGDVEEPAACADSTERRCDRSSSVAWKRGDRARRRGGWARLAGGAAGPQREDYCGVGARQHGHRSWRGPGEPSERVADRGP
jgi:hypothetical protein